MKDDGGAIHVLATVGEAIMIPAFAAGVMGQLWLYAEGIEPPISALASAVILSKPLALMIVIGRDRRRRVAAAILRQHVLRVAYVFLPLFLLVILLWVISDRRHALPLIIGCVGALTSLTLLMVIQAVQRAAKGD